MKGEVPHEEFRALVGSGHSACPPAPLGRIHGTRRHEALAARGSWRGAWLAAMSAMLGVTLSSCVIVHERDGDGKSATYASLGGKGAYRKGYGVVHNHEKSFRDGAVLAGTLATSYFGAVTAKATEVTNQVALKEATRKHASDNALKGQAIEANAAAHGQAIGAELPGTLPATPPPAITP